MLSVSDEFLLTLAEVTAGLLGLFLVGVIFFVESGFRRLTRSREVFEPYIRASTRIVLVLCAVPLGLSLTLPVLTLAWKRNHRPAMMPGVPGARWPKTVS